MTLHIANTDNVSDSGALELAGAGDVATAVIAGTTYLFVASFLDNGVSVFAVEPGGTLVNVDNVTDDATLELDGAIRATPAVIAGTTYLFVTGRNDDGVSVFSVAADGTLTNVDNVTDGGALELDGASGVRRCWSSGNDLFVRNRNPRRRGDHVLGRRRRHAHQRGQFSPTDCDAELDVTRVTLRRRCRHRQDLHVRDGNQDDGVSVFIGRPRRHAHLRGRATTTRRWNSYGRSA